MSKYVSFSLICILILITCPNIFADQIFLKNGDRITGKIVKKTDEKILIQTESLGEVMIDFAAVDKIMSDEPLNIELSDGQLLKGTVATADGKLEVETETAGTVEIEKENIEVVRSVAEQAKFEAERGTPDKSGTS